MGHRAAVVYVTDDGVRSHYSHWGGYDLRLLDEISPEIPYGESTFEEAQEMIDDIGSMFDGSRVEIPDDEEFEVEVDVHDEPNIGDEETVQQDVPIEPEPSWEGNSIESFVEDELSGEPEIPGTGYELVYIVDTRGDDYDVQPYEPLPHPTKDTAYIEVESDEDRAEVREWFYQLRPTMSPMEDDPIDVDDEWLEMMETYDQEPVWKRIDPNKEYNSLEDALKANEHVDLDDVETYDDILEQIPDDELLPESEMSETHQRLTIDDSEYSELINDRYGDRIPEWSPYYIDE